MPKCSVTDSTGRIFTLYYSTNSGDANLTVGFYLEGHPDIIKYLKSWKFGDNTPEEKDHDLVKNHTYFNGSPSSCQGSVTVLDPVSEKPISPQINFVINVTKHNAAQPCIGNFYQTEGVFFQNYKVGCSIDVQGVSPDDIKWEWENNANSLQGKDQTHPWLQYSKVAKENPTSGSVTVFGPNGKDVWNFYAIVLQDPTTLLGGEIDMEPNVWPYVNQEINFLANLKPLVSKLNLPDGYAYRYHWKFETNPSNKISNVEDEEGVIDWSNLSNYLIKRKFSTSENYRVLFTIYRVVSREKNPYLCLSRSFNIRKNPR